METDYLINVTFDSETKNEDELRKKIIEALTNISDELEITPENIHIKITKK